MFAYFEESGYHLNVQNVVLVCPDGDRDSKVLRVHFIGGWSISLRGADAEKMRRIAAQVTNASLLKDIT